MIIRTFSMLCSIKLSPRPVPAVKIHRQNSDVTLGSRDGNKRLVRFRPYLKSDNGPYVCEATNQYGQKHSQVFFLEGDGRLLRHVLSFIVLLPVLAVCSFSLHSLFYHSPLVKLWSQVFSLEAVPFSGGVLLCISLHCNLT